MSSASRSPGLDTLRSAAILSVMAFHLTALLPAQLAGAVQFGWTGVDLFFVLSGYLIGYQLLAPYARGAVPSRRSFYTRRAFRILPVYLVVLVLYYTVPAWNEAPGLAPLWQYLTFTENLFVDYRHNAFNHVWSLCIEEHFYLVLPALVLAMMRRPSAARTIGAIAGTIVFELVVRTAFVIHEAWRLGSLGTSLLFAERIYCPTYTHLDGLVAGVALALVRVFRPAWWAALARRGHTTALAGCAILALALWLCKNLFSGISGPAVAGAIVGFPLLALGFGLLVASSVSDNGWLRTVPVPGAKYVALLAYSLYLVHQSVVHVDQTYFPALVAGRGAEAFATIALSCIACASLLFFGIERPFMNLLDRFDRGRTRHPDRVMLDEPAL